MRGQHFPSEHSNLADETREVLATMGMGDDDVLWAGSPGDGGVFVDAETFWAAAGRTTYYSGYGSAHVPTDLVVMLSDGSWLERWEYDGAEGWRAVEAPSKPREKGTAITLASDRGYAMAQICDRANRLEPDM